MKQLNWQILIICVVFSTILTAQNWTELGPKIIPSVSPVVDVITHRGVGRINCIRFHPDYDGTSNKTLYAGSYLGGVGKTINGWR